MRVVSTKAGYNKVPYDLFIIAENVKYNVPSFATITKGRFSKIKTTTNDIPFNDYWNDTDSLDMSGLRLKISLIEQKECMTL